MARFAGQYNTRSRVGCRMNLRSRKYGCGRTEGTRRDRMEVHKWGCSSVGRAPALQAGGQGFESPHLHHHHFQHCPRSSAGFLALYLLSAPIFPAMCANIRAFMWEQVAGEIPSHAATLSTAGPDLQQASVGRSIIPLACSRAPCKESIYQ